MKKIMLIFLTIFLLQGIAIADDEDNKEKNVNHVKDQILKHTDKKISILSSFKSCVSSASSKDEIKSCRKEKKDSMKAVKKENKKMRKEFRKGKKKGKGKGRRNKGRKNKDDDDDDNDDDDDDKNDD